MPEVCAPLELLLVLGGLAFLVGVFLGLRCGYSVGRLEGPRA